LPEIDNLLSSRNPDDPEYAMVVVDQLLQQAAAAGASDLHFQPTGHGLSLKWRIDGVLQQIGAVPKQVSGNVVVRLKVMAGLLTYQTHLPQEGRIAQDGDMAKAAEPDQAATTLEIRVSTFPTLFGEKVVARLLPSGDQSFARVGDLGLSRDVVDGLLHALSQTSGALLIVGPAGSGKTTTAYACLREILARSQARRNITSMEDPVEVVVEGVAQSEVAEKVGFDLVSGLRSLVRQDPDVIFVGEIRDPATANIAYQAALTGQLVVTTFHASDAATAVSRLVDMGVPPYVLRSATNCVVAQQLVRRLCACATESSAAGATENPTDSALGLSVDRWRLPQGCADCQQTGYRGRQVAAEMLRLDSAQVAAAIQPGIDARQLAAIAAAHGMQTLDQRALELVTGGQTSPAELIRVFGLVGGG
jgi:type II secretory ATPase GspE/PulE/Tfp pilus assembly ATPase PilB-like protein